MVLGALSACRDDSDDTLEGSYARAVCERRFECYASTALQYRGDVDSCVDGLLTAQQQRLRDDGLACSKATLDQWACESQAACYEADGLDEACRDSLLKVGSECPGGKPL